MLTPKMSGIFDCREYDGKAKDHAARKMKDDSQNIAFSALFMKNELPDVFKVNGQPDSLLRERATRKERQAAEAEGREAVTDAFAATFKIGQNAKWFDKYGRACDRPTNADLETNRWNVQIDFVRREKDPNDKLKPSGYWVNAIMVAEVDDNPFAGHAFEEEPEDADLEQKQEPETALKETKDLPF